MSSRRRPRLVTALAGALALGVVLSTSACSTVSLSPAPRANTVACANVTVQLPSTVEGFAMRDTNAQATAAWGKPASIVLTCGITTPRVSDLLCNTVEGVDWLTEIKGKVWRFTSYGRSPGVEVVVDGNTVQAPSNVLFDLASAVGTLPQNAKCQSTTDPAANPTSSPTPTPSP